MKNCQQNDNLEVEKSEDDLNLKDSQGNTFTNERTKQQEHNPYKEYTDLLLKLYGTLFKVWKDDEDPSRTYFPTIQSHTDINLLMHMMRRKKVYGILLITNIINLANLLIPDVDVDKSGQNRMKNVEFIQYASMENDQSNTLNNQWEANMRYFVNLFMTIFLFCFSIYIVFCNKTNFMVKNNGKYEIFLAIFAQYIMAFSLVMFPNLFIFQFLVNITLLFTVASKEAIQSTSQRVVLFGNTFLTNYLAIEGVKYYNQKLYSDQDVYQQMLGFEQSSRAYIIGLITAMLVTVQIQKLNTSLTRMLVGKIQNLQQSLDIKDTYNASMIHELRNPLNAVLGAIGLLKYSRTLSKEDHETLNIASVSGEILITLINNALDGAKIEANKLELQPHKNDIVETLTKTASLFQWKAKEKNINICLKIGKRIPTMIEIDEARITQILVNIIGNAVKFTPENGSIKVRARFIQDDSQNLTSSQKQHRQAMKYNSLGSYLEDDEYEGKFFDNKELVHDMVQASDEIYDEQKQGKRDADNADDYTPGSVTPHEYEMDSITDKSQEPLQHQKILNLQPQIITMNMMKNDYYSSYNHTDLEELKNKPKTNLQDREIDFKNSFHEWGLNTQPLTTFSHQQRTSMPDTPINIHKVNSMNQSEQAIKEETSSQNQSHSQLQSLRLISRTSQAFSESLGRDVSLSMESQYDPNQHYRTYTNSSSSNQVKPRRRNPIKSKFFQQMGSDNINDLSEDDNDPQHTHQKDQLIISEQAFKETLQMIDFEKLREEPMIQECKGQLIIEVIDTGIGISQEGIKKLFQPFQQADKGIQAKYGGTGLGLWITNKLVGVMRGHIDVESELNKGTTFTIKIPVIGEYRDGNGAMNCDETHGDGISSRSFSEKKQKQAKISSQTNQFTLKNDEKFNVLLFQKDEIMTKVFKKYLQKHQIHFKFSTNFKDLLRSFRFQKYNACFIDIDINVTVEDLEKLVSCLQSLPIHDKNALCKIICIYSRDIEKSKAKILQKNQIECLKKPIQGYQLSQLLRRIKSNSDNVGNQKYKSNFDCHGNQFLEDYGQRIATFQKMNIIAQAIQSYPISKRGSGNSHQTSEMQTGHHRLSSSEQRQLENLQSNYGKSNAPIDQLTRQLKQSIVNYEEEKAFIKEQKNQYYYNRIGEIVVTSSSQSSSHTPQHQKHLPKVNKQIERIKQDEMMNSMISPRGEIQGSPRRKSSFQRQNTFSQRSGFIPEHKPLPKKKTHEGFETLLIKNQKLHESPQLKETFRHQISQSSLDNDQEEKKSCWQIQTPNFNNLSQQSHSNQMTASGRTSRIEKDQEMVSPDKNQHTYNSKFSQTLPGGAVVAPQIEQIKGQPARQRSLNRNNLTLKIEDSNYLSPPNQPKTSSDAKPQQKQVVLIVDDNKMNQFIVQKMLEKVPQVIQNKIELMVADNGEEAYSMFLVEQQAENSIKLILMDCEMPVLNGYEAARKIRDAEITNNFTQTLIIGLSGNQGEQHVRKCKLSGMNDIITKPIVFDQLKQIIKRALEPSESLRSSTKNMKRLSNLTGDENSEIKHYKSESFSRYQSSTKDQSLQFFAQNELNKFQSKN